MPTMKQTRTSTRNSQRARPPADSDEPIDLTQPLPSHSKRAQRRQRKLEKKSGTALSFEARGLLDLPHELLMAILTLLRPSDAFVLSRVNRDLHAFVLAEQARISSHIIARRYPILERCLPLPILLQDVDPALHPLLRTRGQPGLQLPQRTPPQNVLPPDGSLSCTCLTCAVRWNALCIAVDFAHWQDHLDKGEPIPTVPRGAFPFWNQELLARNASIVIKSLNNPLWYARILEAHLDSTARSIRRHTQNKADKRPHFHVTDEDMRAGTDEFLQRHGPPTLDHPFSRDNYYMLEAFLPGRSWISERRQWVYTSDGQLWHEMDLELMRRGYAPGRQLDEDALARKQGALVS